jgi:hypothetical protein
MVRALLVLALVACSKKSEPPPAPSRIPIVPDRVTAQLGAVGFVLAVDLHGLDLGKVAGLIPDELGCTRELLAAADSLVVAQGETWEGFITGLPEQPTRKCIAALVPMLGATAQDDHGGYRIDLGETHVALVWHGNIVTITEAGREIHGGDPPGVILDLVAGVPRGANGWIVSSGITNYKLKSLTAWFTASPTTWTFTVNAEASEQDAARPWLERVVDGFTTAATAKGVAVDAKWFAITSTPTTAKLVATIPIDALTPKR